MRQQQLSSGLSAPGQDPPATPQAQADNFAGWRSCTKKQSGFTRKGKAQDVPKLVQVRRQPPQRAAKNYFTRGRFTFRLVDYSGPGALPQLSGFCEAIILRKTKAFFINASF